MTTLDTGGDGAEPREAPVLAGYLAEFGSVDDVVRAARRVREAGFTRFDVHSPFPIHGIDYVMGRRATKLPWLVLAGGVAGLIAGLILQWYANSYDYKLVVSGKPFFSLPAFVPVMFETTILGAALAAVFGMLGLNRLPMLYNPLFKSSRFARVTSDRFFVYIEAADPKFSEPAVTELLGSLGPLAVEKVED